MISIQFLLVAMFIVDINNDNLQHLILFIKMKLLICRLGILSSKNKILDL